MDLYVLRRDATDSDTVKALIRHGVLIPVSVTVEYVPGQTTLGARVRVDDAAPEDVESGVPDVVWGGDQT